MSRVSSRPARRAASAAPSPAFAGFRPQVAVAAVAAAFALQPQLAVAQPRGANVIHGQASVTYNGQNAVVRTVNGAGTRHSAIDWLSFSVPAGSITQFIQPSAASTSINRVIGDDPSLIYGRLTSNGKLVLVNPHGITVGAGAVVDTAGFTASAVGMSEADAIAGRLAFQGGGGDVQVDGQVLARGGDVLLVGSKVQAGRGALVRSEGGAAILAAGERVTVTGRGLEGIRMEVKAGNEALNLGALEGDAVGIFARTLRHSGHISAEGATSTSGKVVLKATGGDAYVDGTIVAKAGDRGGRIDVLGERVALESGALLQANGRLGGGQVRIGGDYQGASAGAPNAKRLYMDANARIEANATQKGKGGRVILWSDEVTRMHGTISARGGAQGGDGGFVEVSGKDRLEFEGLVDLRAPKGKKGQLLLDPEDITIIHQAPTSTASPYTNTFPESHPTDPAGAMFEPSSTGPVTVSDRAINNQLALGDVLVKTSSSTSTGTGGQITVNDDAVISWDTDSSLTLDADKGITMGGKITTTGAGAVHLKGRSGNVEVTSTGAITASKVKLEALAGDVVFDTLSVNPLDYGAAGAKLEIFASGNVTGDRIQANGGNGGVPGAAGGKGGTVHLKFGGNLAVNSIQADGGLGAGDDSMSGGNAGAGGAGGIVTIEKSTGNLVVDGISISASGSRGGDASGSGAGGKGGDGGKVTFKAPGKVIVDWAAVTAYGADGGNGGGGAGATGAWGQFATQASRTDVSGWLGLNAIWTNTGHALVGPEASINGTGVLRNAGTLSLSADSWVGPDRGLENSGLLKVLSGKAEARLVKNTGTVEVPVDTTLDTEDFVSNEGVLNVNGTLHVGPELCVECGFTGNTMLAGFTNQAAGLITGNGTLVVGGGMGTLDNHGKIAPGGVGSTGRLVIDGNLAMQSGSVLHVDLVNKLTHDVLEVTGMASTGGTVEVSHPAGSSIAAGDTFAVLTAASLDSMTMPGIRGSSFSGSASGSDYVLSATAAVPAPAPAGTGQGGAQQQVLGEIIVFQQLFERAAEGEDRIGKDDIVLTDTSCVTR